MCCDFTKNAGSNRLNLEKKKRYIPFMVLIQTHYMDLKTVILTL